jgi:two-component system nitrogen regulation response regulator NtrX
MKNKLVGASPALSEIEQEIDCAARSDAKVLVTGESGVGKDIVARLIHQRSRRTGSFVTINCAGVPDSLMESELFGHVRGSFTGAYRDKRGWLDQAQDGTIFMDEVGEMSLRMQALLLRFLENGEIQRVGSDRVQTAGNVRVVVATNRNLVERVADKTFREDLYYRLNVIHICIPPLRSRREDVAPLVAHFLDLFSESHRIPRPIIAEQAIDKLTSYAWPGNVRELRNIIERLVIRNRSGVIAPADLPREVSSATTTRRSASADDTPKKSTADTLYERIVETGDSFWTVVYDPFMARDLTREDLRAIVARGLEETRGSYKGLVELFNLSANDYKRFLNFLRKYECRLPFQRFRAVPVNVSAARLRGAAVEPEPLVAKSY